jgi:hypothetical protein
MRILLIFALAVTPWLAFADSTVTISSTPKLREGAVAVSPLDQRVMIAAAIGGMGAPRADVHIFRSTDGGQRWTALGPLAKSLGNRTVIGHWDPVLAFDRAGRAYLAVVAATADLNWTIAVYRSLDNGQTWTGVDIASPSVARNDKPWIAIDNSGGQWDGSIHATWFQLQNNLGNAYTVSRDGGQTWTPVRSFPAFGWPFIATGPDGDVYLSYAIDFSRFGVIRSADSGATFGAEVRIESQPQLPLQMVADTSTGPYRGHVYAFTPAANEVYFTRSVDRGTTWSPLRKVSGSAGGMMPSIDVDRTTGEVVLAWYERESTTRARIGTTRSLDGGATLQPTRKVGLSFPAPHAIGEYNQLSIMNRTAVLVWGDEAGVFSAARLDSGATAVEKVPRRRAVRR